MQRTERRIPLAILYLCALAAATGLTLGGCAKDPPARLSEGQPAFYRNLAAPGAKVDIVAARDRLKAAGARVLGDGEPRIGAHGKPVLFLHPKDFCGALVELEQV